jgi:hypothetical protein
MGWRDIPSAEETEIPRSRIKNMLIIVFDSHGLVHKEFVPEGKIVNAEIYIGLLKRIQRVRPEAFCSRYLFLLFDNAPAHKVESVGQF